MAVTNIPNVQNWTVTPQNGQVGYFTLMNTWLGQSTLVIASLQTAIAAQNAANSEINTLATQTENNAIIATGLANYQGEWISSTTYAKGQSVSLSGVYYTSKIDSNLNHLVTDINYWLSNPINDKVNKTGNETISGVKTFSTSPIVPTPTTTGNVITMDNIIQKTAVGIGYGTGSGGVVTQLTNKGTAVTLNKPTGRIILNNSALASGATNYFLFSNSNITINDTIKITTVGGTYVTVGSYSVEAEAVGAGTCYIAIKNNTAGSLSEAVQLGFTLIKGATA